MKNYTSFPLLIVLLISLNSYSQNFAPVGATWYYEIGSMVGGESYSKLEVVSDTIILGKTTSIILPTGGIMGFITSTEYYYNDSVLYVYEDSGVVYRYLAITNSFDTLYNFNANANDFWSMDVDTNCSLTVTVDSTSMIIINGFNLKVLYVSTIDNEFSGTIIEKIGRQTGPLPWIDFLCYGLFDGGYYYQGLRCYSDTVIGSYFTGIAATCDTITGIYDYDMDKMVNVYPNPANAVLTIEINNGLYLENSCFKIYNIDGKELINSFMTSAFNQVDISSYPSGIYFYQLLNPKKTFTGKLIITH